MFLRLKLNRIKTKCSLSQKEFDTVILYQRVCQVVIDAKGDPDVKRGIWQLKRFHFFAEHKFNSSWNNYSFLYYKQILSKNHAMCTSDEAN